MEDKQVCNQVIVFDDFPLFIANILGNDTAAAEQHPLGKLIKGFAFVRRALDLAPKLGP